MEEIPQNPESNSPEQKEQQEDHSSNIKLKIFRHEEKEEAAEDQPDESVRLTEDGRKEAVKSSDNENVEQSVAYGSPRDRSQQTAALNMAGSEEGISGDESLEELKEKLDKELDAGSKLGIDDRLNFQESGSKAYNQWLGEQYKGGRLMEALLKESDTKAESLEDAKAATSSVYAANVADLILRYVKAADRWHELVDDNEDYQEELQRYMGTHAGVGESFLGTVIEHTAGEDELDRFLGAIGSTGFDFNEGFEVDILRTDDGEEKIQIAFEKKLEDGSIYSFEKTVSAELLRNIAGLYIEGETAYEGSAQGRLKLVDSAKDVNKIEDGDILVTTMTTPEFEPAIKRAGAVITDKGGSESHAAKFAKEMKTPSVIGTGNATELLSDGAQVRVDADDGVVKTL